MKHEIDGIRKDSNIPLYIQIVEIIKYQIATGKIKEGKRLPSIRNLADEWGIHMHTIRHAYKELENLGLIQIRRPLGAIVIKKPEHLSPLLNSEEVQAFIRSTISDAENRFSLSPADLISLIEQEAEITETFNNSESVYFIECTGSQVEDHIRQINYLWDVKIDPLLLSHEGDPPQGNLISTYFHYTDIRIKWPEQFHNTTFVSISPAEQIRDKVDKLCSNILKPVVRVCDLSEEQSLAIHADLKLIFSEENYDLETCIVKKANELIEKTENDSPLLFTPRVWAELSDEEKALPNVFKVVYQINSKDLNLLGKKNRWERVPEKTRS